MSKSFVEGLKTSFSGLVEKAHGLSYLPWATALSLADIPELRVAVFDGKPQLPLFGGFVVAVDAENGSRTWLPVLDTGNNPIPASEVSGRDLNDARNRCRAKATALNHGVGMALYSGYEDNVAFLKALNLKPDSDLAKAEPLVKKKPNAAQAAYVEWAAAYTAGKLTDPDFRFDVEWSDVVDEATGEVRSLPVFQQPNGNWDVAVTVTYRGRRHTEYLPIMGFGMVKTKRGEKRMDHQPLKNPTVADWNRAVMRCMTKAVAALTRYGISVYAGDEIADLHREPMVAKAPAEVPAEAQAPAETEAPVTAPAEPPASSDDVINPAVTKTLERIHAIQDRGLLEVAKNHISSHFIGADLECLYEALVEQERKLGAAS